MAEKKQKRPPEAVNGLYSAFPLVVLDSVAFTGASYPAKALIFDLLRQHSGNNNGHLHLSFSWMAKRGWKSRDVIQRARDELVRRNLIIQTRQGGLNIGPSRFAVTWLPITNFVGLDLRKERYHQGVWAAMNDLCIGRKITNAVPPNGKGSPVKQYSSVPSDGTAKAVTVPLAGTKNALLGTSTVPPDGNNECITTTYQ